MPVVQVQITREGAGATREQKAAVIQGITRVLEEVLHKPPAWTHVVIQEIDLDNWGVAGLPTLEYRKSLEAPSPGPGPSPGQVQGG